MGLRGRVIGVAKRVLRSVHNVSHSPFFVPKKNRADLHRYWRDPYDGFNLPEGHLTPLNDCCREYLVKTAKDHLGCEARILEIGCSAGRNLSFLHAAGFRNLAGIDISENAVRLLKASYPSVAENASIYHSSFEDKVRAFSDRSFDLVFTVAALHHVHYESDWIFQEIGRISSRYLLTIEDERWQSSRHFPRNYKRVFESLSWKQKGEDSGQDVLGLRGDYVARLFVRN